MKSIVSSQLVLDSYQDDREAIAFCNDFFKGVTPRYILGRNEWAKSIAEIVDVDGFVDDFTSDQKFLGKSILKIKDLPRNSMVVSSVLGSPITVQKKLVEQGVRQIDYFSFRKYSEKKLKPVLFWDDVQSDFKTNTDKYKWIYGLLQDSQSAIEFTKILNFRLSSNLAYMSGFVDAQYRQYFEDFLALKPQGEVFVDVGGFDGYTSLEFIKRCPDYAGIHVFEPEPSNMAILKDRLNKYSGVKYYNHGLSDRAQIMRFDAQGSSSRVSKDGEVEIQLERLDDILHEPFTFLKMDIEGGEIYAIEGAKGAIAKYHPRLAISVYHRPDDFWRIPEKVLSYREDYKIFFRHYTEGVTETVMFFIPIKNP
jgi:FkbM family methyltransferase